MSSEETDEFTAESIERCLLLARSGSSTALGELLSNCRNYLLLAANRGLDADLKQKVGASDLVQESLLEAMRDFGTFQGNSEQELLSWLRRILLNNLGEASDRFLHSQKRDVSKEVSLSEIEFAITEAQKEIGDVSLVGKLIAHEKRMQVEQAISSLPESYQQLLRWKHQDDLAFEEIGMRIGKTPEAVRKMWARAVEQLKKRLKQFGSQGSV